jgi:hypothetical protein
MKWARTSVTHPSNLRCTWIVSGNSSSACNYAVSIMVLSWSCQHPDQQDPLLPLAAGRGVGKSDKAGNNPLDGPLFGRELSARPPHPASQPCSTTSLHFTRVHVVSYFCVNRVCFPSLFFVYRRTASIPLVQTRLAFVFLVAHCLDPREALSAFVAQSSLSSVRISCLYPSPSYRCILVVDNERPSA